MSNLQTPNTSAKSRFLVARALYLMLGLLCLGLGTLGIFLPLLPTTIFLIVAAWAFARSSPRLHRWLYNHPRFGPMLWNWYEHRVVSTRAKIAAVLAMAGSFVVTVMTTRDPMITAVVAFCLVAVASYLVTRPSTPPRGGVQSDGQEESDDGA